MIRPIARMAGWVAGAVGVTCFPVFAAAPNWTFDAYIRVPYRNTLFLTQDSQGNLYGTTFNNSPNAETVTAFKISDPSGPSPQITNVDQAQVPTFRGYSGITVDEANNIYVSVDPGDSGLSYIKKILPSGQPDPEFGQQGVVREPGVRFQGLTTHGGRLAAAVNWGKVAIFDAKSGSRIGESTALPAGSPAITIRDIALVPGTQEILGVDRDSVYLFSGGTLDSPGNYTMHPLIEGRGKQTAGQGIYYHPETDRIYYTRTGLGHLGTALKTSANPEVIETVGTVPGGPLSEPADAVVSKDGGTLFVTDLRAPVVLRYRESVAGNNLAAAPTAELPSTTTVAMFTAPVPTTSLTLASAPSIAPLVGIPLNGAAISGGAAGGTPQGGSISTATTTSAAPADTPTDSVASAAGQMRTASGINWETGDLRRALSKAYGSKLRLVAFFTDPTVDLAKTVEQEVFDAPGFAAQYPDAIWLRLNLRVDRADVERYGVFRVPTVIIFSTSGQESQRLSGVFNREDFVKAYAAAKQ